MNSSLLNSLIEDNDEEIVEADVNTSDPNSTGTHDVGMNASTDSLNSALSKAKAVTSAPTPTAKIGESEDVSTDDTMENDNREEKLKKLFKIPPKELKLQVEEKIKKSPNIVAALETAIQDYQIPAQVMCNDKIKTIKVNEDMVIAPSNIAAASNKDAIIRALAALLDNISGRIDNRLDAIQNQNIELTQQFISDDSNLTDTEPDPVFNADANQGSMSSIPKEEDTPSTMFGAEAPGDMPTDDNIGESSQMIDLYETFNESSNMGYELFSLLGYDVKPTNVGMYSESVASTAVDPTKLKYMRFDNSGIVNAIKFINKAREAQSDIKEDRLLDAQKLRFDPNWNRAIEELERQFDCKIDLSVVDDEDIVGYTSVNRLDPVHEKVTISKKYGFKLNGFRMRIVVSNGLFRFAVSRDPKLFGQHVVSILLHEIFHNICTMLMWDNAAWITAYTATINAAIAADSAKMKRTILTRYINTLEKQSGNKISKIKKKAMITRLMFITSYKPLKNAIKLVKNVKKSTKVDPKDTSTADAYAKDYLNKAERAIQNVEDNYRTRPGNVIGAILISVATVITLLFKATVPVGFAIGIPASLISIGLAALPGLMRSAHNEFMSRKDLEEQFADAFAAMYKLPVTFFFVVGNHDEHKFAFNDFDPKLLDDLTKTMQKLSNLVMDPHPTDYQRSSQAIKACEAILKTNINTSSEQAKYLKWLVDNFSNIKQTSVDEVKDDPTFDPKMTADLDAHLDNLIQHGRKNINIVESFEYVMRQFGEADYILEHGEVGE
jgi:ABC-type multidrug transport system fused ATPase/permease subunit